MRLIVSLTATAVLAIEVVAPMNVLRALGAVNGAAQLSLPWSGRTIGTVAGGPHNWSGCNPLDGSCNRNHPWNSLDLVPSDGHVFAARGGYAHTNDCGPGFVRIDHGDGYQSSYLHLNPNNIRVTDGLYVYWSQWIGDIGTSTPCLFSSASANHVHFSLWYVGMCGGAPCSFNFSHAQAVDWSATQLGAWVLDDSNPQQQYSGRITPVTGGTTQCPSAMISNDWPSEQLSVVPLPASDSQDLMLRDPST
jgi:hypothetical protein